MDFKYNCMFCPRGFVMPTELRIHVQRQHSTETIDDVQKEIECTQSEKTTHDNISNLPSQSDAMMTLTSGLRTLTLEYLEKRFHDSIDSNPYLPSLLDAMRNCSVSCKTFEDEAELQSHIQKEHSGEETDELNKEEKDALDCDNGSKHSHSAVEEHNELNQKFSCSECPFFTYRKLRLKIHQFSHHPADIPLEGKPWDKGFYFDEILQKNRLVNTVERPYVCGTCGKGFRCKLSLEAHEATHSKERHYPYVCGNCGKGFRCKINLEGHEATHSKERHYPCVCDTCGKKFRCKLNLEARGATHLKERHYPYVCDTCGKGFCFKLNLEAHVVMHSMERDYLYGCGNCGKGFHCKLNLEAHMATHSKERHYPYVCDTCGKGFLLKSNFRRHTNMKGKCHLSRLGRCHKDPFRKLYCTLCNFSTDKRKHMALHRKKEHLKKHCLSPPREQPYVCSTCGKKFSCKFNLNAHKKKTHSNVRFNPRFCVICKIEFRSKKELQAHEATHSKGRHNLYVCDYCGKGFQYKINFHRHKGKCLL